MPNAYSWQFPVLDVYSSYQGLTNAVYCVHWVLTADDGNGHTANFAGEQELGPIDPDNFIPFADLTPIIVKLWVELAMGEMALNGIKGHLDGRIEEITGPPRLELPPPWL